MARASRDSREGDLSIALWISALPLSLGLGYSFYFTAATLALGRELTDRAVGRGCQDAVTPPWEANLALVVYSLNLASVAVAWYDFGAGRAAGTIVALGVCTLLWGSVLPKSNSAHYRKMIIASMSRRCARWQKANDDIRAEAMAELLRKMGIDLPGVPQQSVTPVLPAESQDSEGMSMEAAALLAELNALNVNSPREKGWELDVLTGRAPESMPGAREATPANSTAEE